MELDAGSLDPSKTQELAGLLARAHVLKCLKDPYYWLTKGTKTKDEQAFQRGLDPFRPFPRHEYFRWMLDLFHVEPVTMLRKSRTMMASWLVAGWCSHLAFTTPGVQVVFQSRDEEKALKLGEYVRTLWHYSDPACQREWRLKRPLDRMRLDHFELRNGSSLICLVGDPDKILSLHPTVYVADEAAHMPDFQEAWNAAAGTRAGRMIALSSVKPSTFCDLISTATPADWPGAEGNPPRREDGIEDPVSETWNRAHPVYGLTLCRSEQGWAVPRLHYAADPDMNRERLAEIRKLFSSEAHWKQEMEIEADALAGQLVYPEFNANVHFVDHDRIPRLLTRYMACDPHPRVAHAMLWLGVDAYGDVWVYRELWPSVAYNREANLRDDEKERELTTKEYCGAVAWLEGARTEWKKENTEYETCIVRPVKEKIVARYMDVAGKGFKISAEGQQYESYYTRYHKFGLYFSDPIRWHSAGEDAIRDALRVRDHDLYGVWPRMHISRRCPELALELRKCRYAPFVGDPQTREVPQSMAKVRTHLIDCLRYILTAKPVWSASHASEEHQRGTA